VRIDLRLTECNQITLKHILLAIRCERGENAMKLSALPFTAKLATVAAAISITSSVHAATYQVTDLGTLGGTTSSALDVNNNRQVSGNSLVTSDPGSTGSLLRAYRWTAGTMTNLGSMAPIPPSTSTNRYARGYAINDSGVVVGEFNNDSSRAFVYANGAMTGLTRLAGDNDSGVAHDINNAGVM
jgi:probable HAF family extracellular repeat protein